MELLIGGTYTAPAGSDTYTLTNFTRTDAGATALALYLPVLAPGDTITAQIQLNFSGSDLPWLQADFDDTTVPRGWTSDPVPFNVGDTVKFWTSSSIAAGGDLYWRVFLL